MSLFTDIPEGVARRTFIQRSIEQLSPTQKILLGTVGDGFDYVTAKAGVTAFVDDNAQRITSTVGELAQNFR